MFPAWINEQRYTVWRDLYVPFKIGRYTPPESFGESERIGSSRYLIVRVHARSEVRERLKREQISLAVWRRRSTSSHVPFLFRGIPAHASVHDHA